MDISSSAFCLSGSSSNDNSNNNNDDNNHNNNHNNIPPQEMIPVSIQFLNANPIPVYPNQLQHTGGGGDLSSRTFGDDIAAAIHHVSSNNNNGNNMNMNSLPPLDPSTAAAAAATLSSQEATNMNMALLNDIHPLPSTKKRHHEEHSLGTNSHSHDDDDNDTEDHHDEEDADNGANGNKGSKRRKRSRGSHPRLTWEERIEQLESYKKKHGDLLIPIRFKENPSLGKFVHNTREQYKLFQKQHSNSTGKGGGGKGTKKCSLTAERIRQLEDLGFAWSTQRTKHQKEDWEARLQQLKEYKAKHGDCLVPHGYTEDPSFAEWVHRQRTTHAHMLKEQQGGGHSSHHQHHKHHASHAQIEERMKQLEEIGFHFTVHADKWMEHWHELKVYKEIHGDCQVPTHCPENPKLGRWVHTQRHQRRLQLKGKKSCMTDERVQLLDSLGFSWDVRHLHHQDSVSGSFGPIDQDHHEAFLHSAEDPHFLSPAGMQATTNVPPPDRDCNLQMQQQQNGNNPSSVSDIFGHGMTMV